METKKPIIIKTFEQFKDDNNNANIKALEYLQDISTSIDTLTTTSKIPYKFPRTKAPGSNIEGIQAGDWFIMDIPEPQGYENEKTFEDSTTFENDKLNVTIVINTEYTPKFYTVPSNDTMLPNDEDGEIEYELISVILYTDDMMEEYFIKLDSQITEIANTIINKIENK